MTAVPHWGLGATLIIKYRYMTGNDQIGAAGISVSRHSPSTDTSALHLSSGLAIRQLFSMFWYTCIQLWSSEWLCFHKWSLIDNGKIFPGNLSALGVGKDILSESVRTPVPLFVLRQAALGAVVCQWCSSQMFSSWSNQALFIFPDVNTT